MTDEIIKKVFVLNEVFIQTDRDALREVVHKMATRLMEKDAEIPFQVASFSVMILVLEYLKYIHEEMRKDAEYAGMEVEEHTEEHSNKIWNIDDDPKGTIQ